MFQEQSLSFNQVTKWVHDYKTLFRSDFYISETWHLIVTPNGAIWVGKTHWGELKSDNDALPINKCGIDPISYKIWKSK